MALQQGIITITGNLGNNPQSYGTDSTTPMCNFRLGCTRHYMDRTGVWQPLPTTWITVKAFRNLAKNVLYSLHKGDAVIVTGTLGTESWISQDGVQHNKTVIEASNIGPDLNFGLVTIRKFQKDPPPRTDAPLPGTAESKPVDVLRNNADAGNQVVNNPAANDSVQALENGQVTQESVTVGNGGEKWDQHMQNNQGQANPESQSQPSNSEAAQDSADAGFEEEGPAF